MMKVSILAAACVLVVAACSDPGPQPSTVAPSPSLTATAKATATPPAATTTPRPAPVTDTLTGGRYVFGPFGEAPTLTVEATGPNGWVGYPSWAMDGPVSYEGTPKADLDLARNIIEALDISA